MLLLSGDSCIHDHLIRYDYDVFPLKVRRSGRHRKSYAQWADIACFDKNALSRITYYDNALSLIANTVDPPSFFHRPLLLLSSGVAGKTAPFVSF